MQEEKGGDVAASSDHNVKTVSKEESTKMPRAKKEIKMNNRGVKRGRNIRGHGKRSAKSKEMRAPVTDLGTEKLAFVAPEDQEFAGK
jgi:hypothetical protein